MPRTNEDWQFAGQVAVTGALHAPAGCIGNAQIASDAAIDASKLTANRDIALELFSPATAIAALTKNLFIARGAGSLVGFKAFVDAAADHVSRTVTVDLQRSTAGGAFATILSATIGFTNASTARTLVAGTIGTPAYLAGDLFRVVVTVAGASGNQATGLTVQLIADEAY